MGLLFALRLGAIKARALAGGALGVARSNPLLLLRVQKRTLIAFCLSASFVVLPLAVELAIQAIAFEWSFGSPVSQRAKDFFGSQMANNNWMDADSSSAMRPVVLCENVDAVASARARIATADSRAKRNAERRARQQLMGDYALYAPFPAFKEPDWTDPRFDAQVASEVSCDNPRIVSKAVGSTALNAYVQLGTVSPAQMKAHLRSERQSNDWVAQLRDPAGAQSAGLPQAQPLSDRQAKALWSALRDERRRFLGASSNHYFAPPAVSFFALWFAGFIVVGTPIWFASIAFTLLFVGRLALSGGKQAAARLHRATVELGAREALARSEARALRDVVGKARAQAEAKSRDEGGSGLDAAHLGDASPASARSPRRL